MTNNLEQYHQLIEQHPNNAFGYIARGNIYKNTGYIGRSISDYSKAINLEPNNQYYYILRGLAYFRGKSLDKAKNDFISAIKLNSKTTIARLTKAIVALMDKDYESVELEINATLQSIAKENICVAHKQSATPTEK